MIRDTTNYNCCSGYMTTEYVSVGRKCECSLIVIEQNHLLVHSESFFERMDDTVRAVVYELCYVDVVRRANPDVLLNGSFEDIPTDVAD